MVGGNRTHHGNNAALRGCVCVDTGLAQIVVDRSIKNDAAVVVEQADGRIDGKKSGTQVGTNNILKNGLVGRADRRPAGDADIDENNVEFPEIFSQGSEEPLAIFRNSDVCAVAMRLWCWLHVGAIILARAVQDQRLSDEILWSVRKKLS